jgi:protocatechuate 3,4-dioxygenase beta subunit
MSHHHDNGEVHEHDRGLDYDLARLVSRRKALGVFGGAMAATALAACGSSNDGGGSASSTTATTGGTSTTSTASSEIPEETAGPYPGDGSNGPNVLTESGVVRSDITKSFGDASGVAEGVPTTVEMKLLDVSAGGTAMAGAAVYLWHCDAAGRYSLYDGEIAGENYLRGVQASGKDGVVRFETIFPAAYMGRWPHMHFEIYESLDAASSGSQKLRTSQLAIPKETCDLVYATSGYEQSVQNLAQTSLETDTVFSDGYASQLATVSGSVDDGFTLKLNVGV